MPNERSLSQRVMSGASWSFMRQGFGVVVQLGVGVVLARLLPPKDFGLLGLALVVIGFGNLFVNLGLGPALVQRKDLTDRHIRTAFTISMIAGGVLAGITYALAPWISEFFKDPRLELVTQALSVNFLLSGIQVTGQALLQRDLDFRRLFWIAVWNQTAHGMTTISLAFAGFGVWSLVLGQILQRMINVAQVYAAVRHSIRPLFGKQEIKDLASFGAGISLARIFNYFARKGDYMIIGRVLGSTALGLYTRAYSLMEMPTSRFVAVLSGVLFPAASKVQDDDERFRHAYLRTITVITFFVLPVVGLIVITAPELVVGVYGDQWTGVVLPLQLLGGFGLFRATYNGASAFLRARGWVYRILGCQIVYGLSLLGGALYAAKNFGIEGVALAVGLAITLMWAMIMFFSARVTKTTWDDFVATHVPGVLLAVPALSATVAMRHMIAGEYHNLIVLAICIATCGIVWIGMLLAFPQSWLGHMPHQILTLVAPYLPSRLDPVTQWLFDRTRPAHSDVTE